ncbi:DUF4114 domain-containing protein [Spongiimicrobium sp. 3-5]|uniref:DUF4114 domain-containing protein n=1 Tax=Spongiimicrobium sp. 3-5 TaxID=3332596 RepID=UPI00397F6269
MKRVLLTFFTMISMAMCFAQNYSFLGDYTSDGTPLYLTEPDVVAYETLQSIDNALPESYPVPTYNPQYITSGYDTDIILDDKADVWVTFVAEGAGYKNVLGFYTYDINDPAPAKPDAKDITIIFPNVSAKGSGGSLYAGDKVKIGTFEAGTGIGWVLLANGWKGRVTAGLWQLYSNTDYNPEADESLRYHNVLLNDTENERIILGFEDIRRDYGSCDNDFNDALFYITANPYEAIRTTNYNEITDHSDVSSGNDGGLESNGDLASLIAKRNFDRNKTGNFKNTLKTQKDYSKKTYKSLNAKSGRLDAYFPESAMHGTETTYISSPEDLLAITNAKNIFSIDYYEGQKRVSAALATETKNGVYNHTKTICDRLNDSKLMDVRMVTLQGHQLVYSKLKRSKGEIEYALTFSVKEEGGVNRLYSLWNLDEYPSGDYLNFQVWGSSMGQVTTIVNNILNTLSSEKVLKTHKAENVLPTVFIKSGYYSQGKLHLNIINKSNATWLRVDGNYKATEQDDIVNLNTTVGLSGTWEEEVVMDTDHLFDIGLSITAENSYQHDAIYLADGPWGIDYNTNVDAVANFRIFPQEDSKRSPNGYKVERGISASGEVKETINVFRNLLAGDLQLTATDYNFLRFNIENDRAIEVSLVTDASDKWEERLRYTVEANEEEELVQIAFEDFKDHSGNTAKFNKIRTIVFSVQSNYQDYVPFTLKIDAMALTAELLDAAPQNEEIEIDDMASENLAPLTVEQSYGLKSYPNPFTAYTVVTFPAATREVGFTVSNLNGQVVYQQTMATMSDQRSVRYEPKDLPNGIYLYTVIDALNGKTYQGKLIKK